MGAGCSGNAVLKPLPRVMRTIGRRGNRYAIIKPKEKYPIGASKDINYHNPLSRFKVDSTLSIPNDIFSFETV